jgi:hypothetical protein
VNEYLATGMPFVFSTPTLALRFRQNNGPTPSGDYQPSRSLSMAGSDCAVFPNIMGGFAIIHSTININEKIKFLD